MPPIIGINRLGSGLLASTPVYPSFPLKNSPNGRYLVDRSGVPFRIQGDGCSQSIYANFSSNDVAAYLDDRKARGVNAIWLFYDTGSPFAGHCSPFALQLGATPAGVTGPPSGPTSALPFLKNISGGTWDGDLTFTNHDAAFAFPNDAWFEWMGLICDMAAVRGLVCFTWFAYYGFNGGQFEGWYQTITNSGNTSGVCTAFGTYLANGNGVFKGFKNRPNIVWMMGGDTLPANGSSAATRQLAILQGMQAAGDTHPVSAHWVHDTLPTDQTDISGSLTLWHAYTHGVYPTAGPTYPECRQVFPLSPTQPTFLIETSYWGEHAATRAQERYFHWGAAISCVAGCFFGMWPIYVGCASPDGVSSNTTAWQASTAYALNFYVSKGGNWYRAIVGGTSGAVGPSGTGGSISDGSITWTWAAAVSGGGGVAGLYGEPAMVDFTQIQNLLKGLAWWLLVPSGLASTATIVTAGQGSFATWSSGVGSGSALDWIVTSAASDASFLLGYVPHDHSGAFSIDMTRLGGSSSAFWVDPTNGARTTASTTLTNVGSQSFTIPGANAGGDNDWALLIQKN